MAALKCDVVGEALSDLGDHKASLVLPGVAAHALILRLGLEALHLDVQAMQHDHAGEAVQNALHTPACAVKMLPKSISVRSE